MPVDKEAGALGGWMGRDKILVVNQEPAPVGEMDREGPLGFLVFENLLDSCHCGPSSVLF